jgi:hypothetical protein
MAQKIEPRNSSDPFYNDLLLTCRYQERVKNFLSDAIVEVGLVGEQLKLNPKQAEESVNELSSSGSLNLPGLQVVLDLRTQFGFKLNKGDKLPVYYDAVYYNAAKGK